MDTSDKALLAKLAQENEKMRLRIESSQRTLDRIKNNRSKRLVK